MSHEDILDDMSLSDDEMLDSLADDMLMEMESEQTQDEEVIETINPVRRAPPASAASAMPVGFPFGAPPRGGAGGGMPDLSQMMSQMMPMMSQMFGGAGGGGGGAGMRGGGAALQQQKLSWDEIVKQHVPHNEQDDWLTTIRKDEKTQRDNVASKVYGKPSSRSYHGNAKALPNVYMESDTLLASLLNEAVRAKKAEHNAKWSQYHDNIVSQLTQSGLASVFSRELKQQLRRRVENDPDYAAARAEDTSRFSNIAKALTV